jgi:hypothetical protein
VIHQSVRILLTIPRNSASGNHSRFVGAIGGKLGCARLDPVGLAACIQPSFDRIGRALGEGIRIDGKTLYGSFDAGSTTRGTPD